MQGHAVASIGMVARANWQHQKMRPRLRLSIGVMDRRRAEHAKVYSAYNAAKGGHGGHVTALGGSWRAAFHRAVSRVLQ